MRIIPLILIFLFSFLPELLFSQGVWNQKTNHPGNRAHAVGFSIGNKGYIGLGYTGLVDLNDLWEWDPVTNIWTQKANMPGGGREMAACFTIGAKAYVGTGRDGFGSKQDFWEWDQASNSWTGKAAFGGGARTLAVGFSVGTKGYFCTGKLNSTSFNDVWEWDQATDTWTQKNNFAGSARYGAVGFTIGTKAYLGTGRDASTYQKDFWEWDPVTDTWLQKANLPGMGRVYAVGFSIGNKGYIGTGLYTAKYKDFWEWDQGAGSWSQKTDFGGAGREQAKGFSINGRGYIGTGVSSVYSQDFWEYDGNCTISGPSSAGNANCGSSVTLSVGFIPALNAVYAWSPSTGLSSTTVPNPVASPTSTITYTVTVTDTATQCMGRIQQTAGINQPNLVISGSATTVNCGTPATLTATYTPAGPNLRYKWWPSKGLSDTTIANPVATPTASITYYLIVQDTVTYCSAYTQFVLYVVQPTFSITVSSDSICFGTTASLQANFSLPANAVYSWTPSAGLNNTTIPNPTASPSFVTTYTVMAIDTVNQCSNNAQTLIKVFPIASASGSVSNVCQGQSVNLCAFGGTTYAWSTGATSSCIVVSPTSASTYTVGIWDQLGCYRPESMNVSVVANCGNSIPCANNEGFENGNFFGWTGLSGTNSGNTVITWSGGLNNLGLNLPVSSNSQHTLISVNGLDPYAVDSATGQKDVFMTTLSPIGGTYSVRLGNSQFNCGAEALKIPFTPTATDSVFIYQFACVFQNAGHVTPHEPGFMVHVYDTGNVIIPAFSDTIYGPDPQTPLLPVSASAPDWTVLYKRWTNVVLNLSAYIGRTLTIEFINFDCSECGHWGYTYLDVSCNSLLVDISSFLGPDDITIYPNPSPGNIKISGKWNKYDLVVTDMLGVVQFSERITGEWSEIDLSRLKSGVYLVQVNTGSVILNKKIVIQK